MSMFDKYIWISISMRELVILFHGVSIYIYTNFVYFLPKICQCHQFNRFYIENGFIFFTHLLVILTKFEKIQINNFNVQHFRISYQINTNIGKYIKIWYISNSPENIFSSSEMWEKIWGEVVSEVTTANIRQRKNLNCK